MLTSIISFFAGIGHAVGCYFKIRSCPNVQRREAEKDVEKQEASRQLKEAEIDAAVHGKDDDTVTRITHDLLSGLAVGSLVCTIFVYGCFSEPKAKTVYVPTTEVIESCTNSYGIACKAVPDTLYAEMLKRLQELKDLKTEMKVDKRLSQ